MKAARRHAFILALLAAPAALAAGGGDEPRSSGGPPADPVLENVLAANARQDWAGSQALLREALARNPGNADYHNLYAYAVRKGPNPSLDVVFRHYNEALRINPDHLGAHEYIGEAYLMVGNPDKAKEHLAALDRLCLFSCEEYRMLKRAVAEYEAKLAGK